MLGVFTPQKSCFSYGCVHWVIIESVFLTLGHGQKLWKPWLSQWLSKLQLPAVLTIYLCKTFLPLEARPDSSKANGDTNQINLKQAFFLRMYSGFCVSLHPLFSCRSWGVRYAWVFYPNVLGHALQFISINIWLQYMSIMKTVGILVYDIKRWWWFLLPFSNHAICANSAILGEMGTELALNQASGPCLKSEGTCTAIWETLCSRIIQQLTYARN